MNGHQFPWMNPVEFKNYIQDLADKGQVDILVAIINAFVDYTVGNDTTRATLSADLRDVLGPEEES